MSPVPMVPSTHDVSSRLSWELESPVSRRTDNIATNLEVNFSDGSSWEVKQGRMKKVCTQFHSKVWVARAPLLLQKTLIPNPIF